MTINTAVEQLLEAENEKKEVATNTSLNHFWWISPHHICIRYLPLYVFTSSLIIYISLRFNQFLHNAYNYPCCSTGLLHWVESSGGYGSAWPAHTEGTHPFLSCSICPDNDLCDLKLLPVSSDVFGSSPTIYHMHSQIVFGTLKELLQVDFGPPLHSLALCGETHPLESEVVDCHLIST